MSLVKHERCSKCKKVLNISSLEENKDGTGKICMDIEACKERVKKSIDSNTEIETRETIWQEI